jgi:hypothetical protein
MTAHNTLFRGNTTLTKVQVVLVVVVDDLLMRVTTLDN